MNDMRNRLIIIAIILPVFLLILHLSFAHYIIFTVTIAIFGIFLILEVVAMFKNKNHYLKTIVLITQFCLCLLFTYLSSYNLFSPLFLQVFCLLNILISSCFYIFKDKIESETITMILHIFLFLYIIFPLLLIVNMFLKVSRFSSYFLFFLLIVWSSNSLAYIVGTSIKNRHPLGLSVSPNKSTEGFIGGIVFGTAIPIALYYIFFSFFNFSIIKLIILIFFTNIFTILGDLFESALKRYCKVKNSSSLFKGHGGLLDMTDSIIFSFPLFYLLLLYLR